ncbi:hypothetical protein ACSVH2_08535 [Flavobacterium sp. RSB2_4_14]|uniref:hypothetical protein n=1 Tax=Flavobacterium sp. RSB2_4_14 TaxID=3447665 RepID=UPI003F37E57F
MNKLKINLLGTGVEIKRILLPESVLDQWKGFINPKSSITKALLDPFFYYKLKDKKYNCLEDLPSENCSGIINAPKSQIEFWFNRKKVSKVNTFELFNENLLFPLFSLEKTTTSFLDNKGIYILQNEIGTIGTYELMVNSEKLTIDDFIFEIDSIQNTTFIKNIKYKNQDLEFVKKDTMVTYQIGFEV